MDILSLSERVRNTIFLGESHFREFKSALDGIPGSKKPRAVRDICKDIAEALVSFANADGGELLVGVEDDGVISGIPHDEMSIQQILNAPKTHVHVDNVLPILTATRLELDGKQILFFSVAKGTTEIYQLVDGRCVRRKDKVTVPVAFKQIVFERQEVRSREYDRQFVDGASVGDLDMTLLQSLADRFLKGLSIERYLQQLDLAEYATGGLRLRMACLLLFAKDIQRWHPRSQVRILRVVGTQLESGERYNVNSDETVRGNIFELLLSSWERLRSFLADKTTFGADAKFEQKYIYPEGACREALINAIAHRDYHIQNGIEIFIFDDRMEIKSPGALLSTLSIENLQELHGAHESRNVLVAKVLRENEYMRELGEGMRRMFELMEQYEKDKPGLYSNGLWFSVTLSHRSSFSSHQEKWLSLFSGITLTPYQKKIVVAGMEGREISPNEIYRAMNTDDRDTYDREVTGLRKKKVLIEIRKNTQAQSLAREKKIQKGDVARFKVVLPTGMGMDSHSSVNSKPKDTKIAVFVTNLSYETTEIELRNLFGGVGNIDTVQIPHDENQRSKGFAFVWYVSELTAQKAIATLNGVKLDGQIIRVKAYQPPQKRT